MVIRLQLNSSNEISGSRVDILRPSFIIWIDLFQPVPGIYCINLGDGLVSLADFYRPSRVAVSRSEPIVCPAALVIPAVAVVKIPPVL